jgi:predicted NBD/HSP70 family sugar kinase
MHERLPMRRKEQLSQEVLAILLREGEAVRSELIRRLDARPATLFGVIRDLAEKGLIEDEARNGRGTGRKAAPIRLNGACAHFLGVDFDVERTVAVRIDATGAVIESTVMPSEPGKDAESGRTEILEAIRSVRGLDGPEEPPLAGIGFADPGLVDVEAGVSRSAVNIPGWKNVPVGEWLLDQTTLAARVVPAATARAYLEYLRAHPPPRQSLLHVTLDIGIGGGFVKDGRIFYGDTGSALEVGHVVVEPEGPPCQCGSRGCLEAVAGGAAIRRRVNELLATGVTTALAQGEPTIDRFVACVRDGDRAATALAHDLCASIGAGIASAVAVLNPTIIVLSGALTGLGPFLTDEIRRVLSVRCLPSALESLQLRLSDMAETATARGAALLRREQFLLGSAKPGLAGLALTHE